MDQITIPDAANTNKLAAMELVAKLRAAADKQGIGFVGGFISPDGEKFVMSNMNEADMQMMLPDQLK